MKPLTSSSEVDGMNRVVVDKLPRNCNECVFSCMGCEIADYHRAELDGWCPLLVEIGEFKERDGE